MRSTYRSLSVLALGMMAPVAAQATNGYQLMGVGSYQKSLGGAVTANPGSAMTAITNPAGMARVGSRADFSMEAFMPEREVDFGQSGGQSSESATDMYGVPAIGWTAPVSDQRPDLYFGGGMYGTSGMGVDYPQTAMAPGMNWEGYSNISFWQMAPSLAWNVDERLSVGASLNIDYQQVAFKQKVTDASNNVVQNFDLSRSASAFGFGLSLGLLYDVNDRLTLGASYKSKQSFSDLEYNLGAGDLNDGTGPAPAGIYKLGLDYPQQLAAGLAFDATPRLEVSADVKWIEWSATMDKLAVEGPGGIVAPMDPGWDDQVVYALGIAYAVNDRLNLRAGFNYGESPIDESNASRNLILPAVVETHYAAGFDYAFNNHWQVGMHYMYVPEKSFTAPMGAGAPDPDMGQTISLSETSLGVNLGYRF